MLQLTRVVRGDLKAAPVAPTVTLSFEDRRRSRLLVRLDDGQEAALMLPRGTVLREGDLLAGQGQGQGEEEGGPPMVRVRAAAETLSVARTAEPLLLSRGAYHLGNRHVPLQIGPGRLAYQHDHVLDDLARALGLQVTTESAPFEPEAGGYPHQGSAHHHGEGHGHSHSHSHSHSPLPQAGEGNRGGAR